MKKVFLLLFTVLLLMPSCQAKRYAVKAHTRHYKSGKVVRVERHTRCTKHEKWLLQ